MDNKINFCNWEKIEKFKSENEFCRFLEWIDEQLEYGYIEEVRVKNLYGSSSLFNEKWYKCKESGSIWRVVAPDPPFEGVFEPIE